LLLLLLSLRLVYWQLVRGEELRPPIYNTFGSAAQDPDRLIKQFDPDTLDQLGTMPQPARQRTLEILGNITRGTIYDRNGRPLAYNVTAGEREVRFYAEPSLAPVVGYVSALNVGVTGIERAANGSLMGLDRLDTQISQLTNQPITGSDVYLTIDSRVQRTADAALGGRPGAVIAVDARDGSVLALASAPTFDPNRILDEGYAASLLACTDPSCLGALLNRATQGLYAPGSTWKTVTLAAALDSGLVTPQTVFDFGEPRQGPSGIYYVYPVNGFEIVDPNHSERHLDLVRSYAVSANAAFARMGDEMGRGNLCRLCNPLWLWAWGGAAGGNQRQPGPAGPRSGCAGRRRAPGFNRVRTGRATGFAAEYGAGGGDDRQRWRYAQAAPGVAPAEPGRARLWRDPAGAVDCAA
jgi:hypothetical protein